MGIPGFNVWFQQEHKSAYVPLSQSPVDHLYFDMNGILHNVLRRANDFQHFHVRLYQSLDHILKVTSPRKSVVIAIDGPAPLAKLLTQRDRRQKTTATEKSGKKKGIISKNAITPGTSFMADLSLSLQYFIASRLATHKWGHLHFELSGPNVQGEGEIKIMDRLVRPLPCVRPGDSHMIVGGDADLVLMALVSWVPHMHVLNDANQVTPKTKVLSVDQLHASWQSLGPPESTFSGGLREKLVGYKLDLAMLAIISSGNDYLPGLSDLRLAGSGKSLWRQYKALRGELGYQARSLLVAKEGSSLAMDTRMLHRLLLRVWGEVLNQPPQPDQQPTPAAREYLRGILWVLQMYLQGACPDYRWYFEGGPPGGRDLLAALQTLPPMLTLSDIPPRDPEMGGSDSTGPLLPHVCALSLLTGSDVDLIAEPLRPLMDPESPIGTLFNVCDACAEFSAASAAANKALNAAIEAIRETEHQIKLAEAVQDSEKVTRLQAQLEQQEAQREAARNSVRTNEQQRQRHKAQAHPYQRFPVALLESTAAALDLRGLSPAARATVTFGRSFLFRRRGGQDQQHGKYTAPPPPSPRFQVVRSHTTIRLLVDDSVGGALNLKPDTERTANRHYLLDEHFSWQRGHAGRSHAPQPPAAQQQWHAPQQPPQQQQQQQAVPPPQWPGTDVAAQQQQQQQQAAPLGQPAKRFLLVPTQARAPAAARPNAAAGASASAGGSAAATVGGGAAGAVAVAVAGACAGAGAGGAPAAGQMLTSELLEQQLLGQAGAGVQPQLPTAVAPQPQGTGAVRKRKGRQQQGKQEGGGGLEAGAQGKARVLTVVRNQAGLVQVTGPAGSTVAAAVAAVGEQVVGMDLGDGEGSGGGGGGAWTPLKHKKATQRQQEPWQMPQEAAEGAAGQQLTWQQQELQAVQQQPQPQPRHPAAPLPQQRLQAVPAAGQSRRRQEPEGHPNGGTKAKKQRPPAASEYTQLPQQLQRPPLPLQQQEQQQQRTTAAAAATVNGVQQPLQAYVIQQPHQTQQLTWQQLQLQQPQAQPAGPKKGKRKAQGAGGDLAGGAAGVLGGRPEPRALGQVAAGAAAAVPQAVGGGLGGGAARGVARQPGSTKALPRQVRRLV